MIPNQTAEEYILEYNELNRYVCSGFQIIGYTEDVKDKLKELNRQKDKFANIMYHENSNIKGSFNVMGILTVVWKIKGSVRCSVVYSEVHLQHFRNFTCPADYELEFINKKEVK